MAKAKKTVSIAPVDEIIEEVAPVKKVKKVRAKSDKPRKPNAWLIHVKAYREKHPDVAYKVCLQEAKKTYVKGGSVKPSAPIVKEVVKVKVVKTKTKKNKKK
tara:strand:+ start:405 stop:710 length:306 start_codon:yes stop_codon:yes gene_type:complete